MHGLGGLPSNYRRPLSVGFRIGGVNDLNRQSVFLAVTDAVRQRGRFKDKLYVGYDPNGIVAYHGNFDEDTWDDDKTDYQNQADFQQDMLNAASSIQRVTGLPTSFARVAPNDAARTIIFGTAAALPPPPPPPPVSIPSGEGLYSPNTPPPSTTMTVKQLQERLMAAGVSVRGGADGRWGANTKAALETFAGARGISLPTLGARSDYMQSGSNITIPSALDSALPAASGSSSRSGGGGGGGGARPPAPTPDVTPDVPTPVTPGFDYGGKSEEETELPWPWIGAGVGVVALLGIWYMRSRRAS